MKNRMKTHLKYLIVGLALAANLGLVNLAQAESNAQTTAQNVKQPVAVMHLAWQRVGAPLSSMQG